MFQELLQRDEKREVEQQNLLQKITLLEKNNEEHKETETELRKCIADLEAGVDNSQQTFDQQQRLNNGSEKREAQLDEYKLKTAATEWTVEAQENPLPISSSEGNLQRQATDKSTSNSSEETCPTPAPMSVAGSDFGDNTDSWRKGKTHPPLVVLTLS